MANCHFRALVLEEAAADVKFAEDLWILCSRDILFWLNTFAWTDDAEFIGEGATPFVAFPKQAELLQDMQESILRRRSHAVVKARRIGVSWLGMALAAHTFQFLPASRGLLASRTEEDVDKSGDPKALMWKIDFLLEHEPGWMRPPMNPLTDRTSRHFRNPENRATIEGSRTHEDIGRGGGYTYIWVDEAAAIEVLTEAMDAIQHASRCRFLVSTPKGAVGGFHDAYQASRVQSCIPWHHFPPQAAGLYRMKDGVLEALDKEFIHLPGYPFVNDGKLRSPYFDERWAEVKNPRKIAQEMECEFLGSGWEWFPKELIDRLIATTARPPLWEGDLRYDPDSLEPIRLVERGGGPLRLWIEPDTSDLIVREGRFAMGSDVAQGSVDRPSPSESVNSVVNIRTGEKVAEYVTRQMGPEEFARLSIALAKLFRGGGSSALHGWDAGGPGHSYGREIVKRGSGHIWYRRDEKRVDRRTSLDPGVYLNGLDVRKMIFQFYLDSLSEGRFINRSVEALRDCYNFHEAPNGKIYHQASDTDDPSGAGDNHGDRTIADLVACWIAKDSEEQVEKAEPQRPAASMGARMLARKRELDLATAW